MPKEKKTSEQKQNEKAGAKKPKSAVEKARMLEEKAKKKDAKQQEQKPEQKKEKEQEQKQAQAEDTESTCVEELEGELHEVESKRKTKDDEKPEYRCLEHRGNPMEMTPHELGVFGEALAYDYLMDRGWDVLETNWTCPAGEADLIAMTDDGILVFAEVKTRKARLHCIPELAVDKKKKKKYEKISQFYIQEKYPKRDPDSIDIRFDIIAIYAATENEGHLRHIQNAYGLDF